jgi:hypothetical protein
MTMDDSVIHRHCCIPLKANPMNDQKTPLWFWISAALGLLWNLFGLFRFSIDSFASVGKLVAGGTVGCIFLLLRNKQASTVFAVSFVGYTALYAGDVALGVFAAFGAAQVAILTTVVLIAAALLWLARISQKRAWLR